MQSMLGNRNPLPGFYNFMLTQHRVFMYYTFKQIKLDYKKCDNFF